MAPQSERCCWEMYETISFHTHKLVVEEGAKAWHLEEYHG